MGKYTKRLTGLMCMVIMILSIMATPVKVNAAGEETGGFDLNLYTLKQLEDAGFIRYFFILTHEGNKTAGYYSSAEEIAYAGLIRCFIEFNPRPFTGTIYEAKTISSSPDYSWANPVYIFNNSITMYDSAVLDLVGFTVYEIDFSKYPGLDPTQFTLPTLESTGYANRIANEDYKQLRRTKFDIVNVVLYDKFCYVDYTFQILNEKKPTSPSRGADRVIIAPGYLSKIPDKYDEEHGIAPSLSYTKDHDVGFQSDVIEISSMPMGISSLW